MSIAQTMRRLAAQFKPPGSGATAQVDRGAEDSAEVSHKIAQQRVEAQEALCTVLRKEFPRAVAEVDKRVEEHRMAQQDVKNGTGPVRPPGFAAPLEHWSDDAQTYFKATETLKELQQEAQRLHEPVRQANITSALAASGLPEMAQHAPDASQAAGDAEITPAAAKLAEQVFGLQFGLNGELMHASGSPRSATASLQVPAAILPAPVLPQDCDARRILQTIGNLAQKQDDEIGDAVADICKNIKNKIPPTTDPIVRAFLFSQLVHSAREVVSLKENPSLARNALVARIGVAWANSRSAVAKLTQQLPQHQDAMRQLEGEMILYIKYHAESSAAGNYKAPAP
jgi:hypothetical protein